MSLIPVKTPVLVKKLFSNYIWNCSTEEKNIYLTFDDGPTPEITDWVLDVLKKFNAKATFFCIGKNVDLYPKIFNRILEEGHNIGNHTYNHISGLKTSTNLYLENANKARDVINKHNTNFVKKESTSLFRPPYGQITSRQGKKLIASGYKIIMWDVLSIDWDSTISQKICLNNVIKKTSNGSIVVFHDSLKAAKNMQYALPKVLEHFNEKGYLFKAIKI